jgi:hypothetical protein
MKLAVPNLKNVDYKQLGIDHGEKVAIAIVGLLLLFVLWSTNWKQPVAESPAELADQATNVDEQIKKQPWPPGEIGLLKTGTDLNVRATSLLTPVELSPWLLPVPMNKPYHPDRTLITKPKWLAVRDLIADAQVADLEMDPKVPPLKEGFRKLKKDEKPDKAKKTDKKEKEVEEKPQGDDEFKRPGAGDAPVTLDLGSGFKFGGGKMGGLGRKGKGPGERVENKGKRQSRRRKKPTADETQDETVAKKVKEKPVGRGYHVVAVRGVFPLSEQVAEMVRALGNSVTRHDAQEAIQLHDFKLERQTAKAGPEPWSGPWEPVDREATLEMFRNDIYSFAPESVSDGIVDNHICMPLPVRLVGEWGRLATHPAVRDFVLSPDEIKTQLEYQRKVIEKMQKEDEKKHEKDDTGGFAPFTSNPRKVQKRGVAAQADENSKSIQQQILDELQKAPKDRPSEEAINDKLTDYISKHATPQDHLLLFRYVDFNVEPGKVYRYRVQLVVENPFRDRHAEEVNDPSLIERPTRETDWSQPTKPVYVPEDARFFVTRADGRPGRSSLPNADVDLYQWFASTGTVVNQRVRAQVGQLIGGLQKALVLNPAEDTSEDEKVPFSTNDALVDVATGFSLDPVLHHDLISEIASAETKDKSEPKEKKATVEKDKKGGSMVPDVVVFVDENGALRVIDGLDQDEDHQIAKQRYTFQKEQWQEPATGEGGKARRRGPPVFGKGGRGAGQVERGGN